MNFNFNESAGITNGPKQLAGNKIHDVTFDGCEIVDGVEFKNGKKGDVLDIKFSNSEGYFTKRIFEPTAEDFKDRDSQYGPNPSNIKSMMLLFKHLIDTVNPELAQAIDNKEKEISAPTWKGLRKLMVEATKNGIGTETKIKLMRIKDRTDFPGFFAAYSKEGKLYMKSYFIGNSIYFSDKEIKTMNTVATASPTPVSNDFSLNSNSEQVSYQASTNDSDLDFKL